MFLKILIFIILIISVIYITNFIINTKTIFSTKEKSYNKKENLIKDNDNYSKPNKDAIINSNDNNKDIQYINELVKTEISNITQNIQDAKYTNYITTKIQNRLWDEYYLKNDDGDGDDIIDDDIIDDDADNINDDDDDNISDNIDIKKIILPYVYNNNNFLNNNNNNTTTNTTKKLLNTFSSDETILLINSLSLRLFEKDLNGNLSSIAALYFVKAKVLQGHLPVHITILFYKSLKNYNQALPPPICYMNTIIYTLGKPIILKEIFKHLIPGETYRIRILSTNHQHVFYDDTITVFSPLPEMIPLLVCQDAVLFKYNKFPLDSSYKHVIYNPDLFSLNYLVKYPYSIPTLGTIGSNILDPITGSSSGHLFLHTDPIQSNGYLVEDEKLNNYTNADLTLIKNPANPNENFVLLKMVTPITLPKLSPPLLLLQQHHPSQSKSSKLSHFKNIKGWIINYKSQDGTEYKQIYSLSAILDKYSFKSSILVSLEPFSNLEPTNLVTIWNTEDKIGIEKNNCIKPILNNHINNHNNNNNYYYYNNNNDDDDDNSDNITINITDTTSDNDNSGSDSGNCSSSSSSSNIITSDFPKSESFFQRDPYIIFDKLTREFVMLTFEIDASNVLLNPRWSFNPCHSFSRDRLLVINPQKYDWNSPFCSKVSIYKGVSGGQSFTRQQGILPLQSSIIVNKKNNLTSLHLPVINISGTKLAVQICRATEQDKKYEYSLVDIFKRSLPVETPFKLKSTDLYPCVLYTRIPPSSGGGDPSYLMHISTSYAGIGGDIFEVNDDDATTTTATTATTTTATTTTIPTVITTTTTAAAATITTTTITADDDDNINNKKNNSFVKLTNIINNLYTNKNNKPNDKNNNKCTIFAIGLTKHNGDAIPDKVVMALQSSLTGEIYITDNNGITISRSKNFIICNRGIIIISKDVQVDSSTQRWLGSIPFGLGPCKESGRNGILGNCVPLFTVDHVLEICKVFAYQSIHNPISKYYTLYLSNNSIQNRTVSNLGMNTIVALYLAPENQGKRIILNAIFIKSIRKGIFTVPSKESIGNGAENATVIIVLDRLIYTLMAELITSIEEQNQHFSQCGLFKPSSALLNDSFVKKHIDITKWRM
uniref:Wsv216-like protein n=1 Tax=Metapenaeus joyneri majanivirus TaxID=2984280 RepID=A0A9C7C8R1_9VIRU|nr:MAG: wsv216-like protein [Metapenaeus joyneri majanivirus]